MKTLGANPRKQEDAKGSPDCPSAVLGGELASASASEQLLLQQASTPGPASAEAAVPAACEQASTPTFGSSGTSEIGGLATAAQKGRQLGVNCVETPIERAREAVTVEIGARATGAQSGSEVSLEPLVAQTVEKLVPRWLRDTVF